MDNNLKAKILFEISQIDRLLSDSSPLLRLCGLKTPDYIEMSAAAFLLHSFYNGIENILVSILKHCDEELPNGHKWHMELLDRAFVSSGDRKRIFQPELQKTLEEYLKFRHFIRHAYGFQLEWTRMENLITNVNSVWQSIKDNLNVFMENSPESGKPK